jgi:predicted phage terminase large subunit-like protein
MMKRISPRQALNSLYRTDLLVFLERAFLDLDLRSPLHLAPYLKCLAAALREVAEGRERRLIINLPPRHLKSVLASIVFPAWLLGRDPRLRIAVVSHSQSLAHDLALKSHRLVTTNWYGDLFPRTRLATDRTGVMDFETAQGGGRYAASMETGITGRGFDLIIVDDPISEKNARSAPERDGVKQSFDGMVATRLDNPAKGAILIIHQRLHEEDLTGHLLGNGGWSQLSLPLIAEEAATYHFGAYAWTRERGDVLLPELYPEQVIQELRKKEARFATQYQQNPSAAYGELIKAEWIGRFDTLPGTARRLTFSIDTAVKTTEDASFTVILVIASDDYRHYLINVLREHLNPVQTRDAVIRMLSHHGPARILVEDASSGTSLVDMLRERGVQAELWPTRGRSKEERLEAHLHMFIEGRVLVQENQPWAANLVQEWASFPYAKFNDQVDTISQYLDWFASRRPVRPIVVGVNGAETRAMRTLFRPVLRRGEHPMRPRSRRF